jgi:hypothetical protein
MMNKGNDQVVEVSFRDEMVYLRLADGCIIGNPLESHSWLSMATPEQRGNIEMYELSVYFPDLDESFDVEGMPPHIQRKQNKVLG